MTNSLDEAAKEFVDKEICYGGLEYALSGNINKECVKSFKAGALWAEKHSPKVLALVEALEDCIKQCDFASEILTLTHKDLSNVEMNTLTTRQYMIWRRSAKSDAVERARDAIANWRSGGGE